MQGIWYLMGVGLLLVAVAGGVIHWAADRAFRRAAAGGAVRRCSRCLYPVAGLGSGVCPECGHVLEQTGAIASFGEPRGVRRKMLLAGVCWTLLMLGVYAGLTFLIGTVVPFPRVYSGRISVILRADSREALELAYEGVSADPRAPADRVLMNVMPLSGSGGRVPEPLRLMPAPTPGAEDVQRWLLANGHQGPAAQALEDAAAVLELTDQLRQGTLNSWVRGVSITQSVTMRPGGAGAVIVPLGGAMAIGLWFWGIRALSAGGLKPGGPWVFGVSSSSI